MPQKGWNLEEDISRVVWKRILMGPRPPSARWPTKEKRNVSAAHLSNEVAFMEAAVKALGVHPEPTLLKSLQDAIARAKEDKYSRSPDEAMDTARAKVVFPEAAIQALGDADPATLRVMQDALTKAKMAVNGAPVGVRFDSCDNPPQHGGGSPPQHGGGCEWNQWRGVPGVTWTEEFADGEDIVDRKRLRKSSPRTPLATIRCRRCAAQYGLRSCRVGEASNPGPVLLLTEVDVVDMTADDTDTESLVLEEGAESYELSMSDRVGLHHCFPTPTDRPSSDDVPLMRTRSPPVEVVDALEADLCPRSARSAEIVGLGWST